MSGIPSDLTTRGGGTRRGGECLLEILLRPSCSVFLEILSLRDVPKTPTFNQAPLEP